MSKNANWKNFDHTYGPLPTKANEYLKLEKDIKKMEYNARQRVILEEMIGDEYATTKSYHLTQKRGQLKALETELMNNRYLYRDGNHMATVIRYLWPQIEEKRVEPATKVAAPSPPPMPSPPSPPPPPKVQNDAWY
jgi:hypothetical protein